MEIYSFQTSQANEKQLVHLRLHVVSNLQFSFFACGDIFLNTVRFMNKFKVCLWHILSAASEKKHVLPLNVFKSLSRCDCV